MNTGYGKYEHDDEFLYVDENCIPNHAYIPHEDREPLHGFWDSHESRKCRKKTGVPFKIK